MLIGTSDPVPALASGACESGTLSRYDEPGATRCHLGCCQNASERLALMSTLLFIDGDGWSGTPAWQAGD